MNILGRFLLNNDKNIRYVEIMIILVDFGEFSVKAIDSHLIFAIDAVKYLLLTHYPIQLTFASLNIFDITVQPLSKI